MGQDRFIGLTLLNIHRFIEINVDGAFVIGPKRDER